MNKVMSFGEKLARLALKRPVTIMMLSVSMLITGLFSSQLLPLERFPGIDIPELFIQIPYRDATPVEVETMITRPVEEAIATMSGIKRLRSSSSENQAEIHVQFGWGQNITAKGIEAREKIDAIRATLPDDVERVFLYQFNTTDMPIFRLRVSSERDLSNAYDLLDRNLKRPLERIPGVSRVTLYGVQKKQISIRVDQSLVTALKIDTAQLVQTLQQANFSMTAGNIQGGWQTIRINPVGEFQNLDEIRNLYIKQGVQLKDIATVEYETPPKEEGRHLDRTFAVGFDIFRESSSNLVDVSRRILEVIDEANDNPAFHGINLMAMDDEAKSVTTSLQDLLEAGLIGALLSFVVLYLFLRNLLSTLIVVLSVPFSICITLGFMFFFGYSINILSLMGLMLAIGMLVDNAVVVTESIHLEQQSNSDKTQATIKGVTKVSLAMIAGTATTAIVFLPNIIGEKIDVTIFLEHVAIAICISLIASLVIAQTLIPLLINKLPAPKKREKSKSLVWQQKYRASLAWCLKHQASTAFIAVAILVSTAIPFSLTNSDSDNNDDQTRIWLNYNIQGNYSLEEVEETVNKMEAFLYDNKERFYIDTVYSYYRSGQATSGLTIADDAPVDVKKIKEMIKESFPVFVRAKPTFQWSSNAGGGIRMTLLGQSSETLVELADQLVPVFNSIDGLTDVRADIDADQRELQVIIDRQRAYRFGLNIQDIANKVGMALRGTNLRTFRASEEGEIAIRLLFDESLHQSIQKLKNLPIKEVDGQNVTLDMIADINVETRLGQIRRYHRQTALAIGANLTPGTTLEQAKKDIKRIMQSIELPSGYELSLDGSFRNQEQAESTMITNMILAVCMIYIVMAALFESLLLPTAVITSLIYSITGVFWAFLITGTAMSVMGMIGMLVLMGIVVNNGIVLVDRINQLIDEGYSVHDAILEGAFNRVRPILMTVLTTVLGLIPLALGDTKLGGDGPGYTPMAIAIIGGLTFSTLTSLYLVPMTYLLLLKIRRKASHLVTQSKQIASRLIQA
ncbi:efflux RND transporter permease subunit [Alteromonas sp. a30]|uniref:efflux RND transporter permease subunit n=1 Tax=Alteromonas sp. a30 TaxID=2730917 RepID=UPI0022811AA0|nr:efflux RND transporter permease subunit [Alteromonas sp. a30]MCY7293935.1 efflux RND transporter permease subunit [Alteromonas sp. a30]